VTAVEHYREAEALARHARELRSAAAPGRAAETAELVRERLAEAQLHATLAVAAWLSDLVDLADR
jgi:hypothetical protein